MSDRNLACKTCGTKVFKSPGEVEDHHKEAHPEAQSQEVGGKVVDREEEQEGDK